MWVAGLRFATTGAYSRIAADRHYASAARPKQARTVADERLRTVEGRVRVADVLGADGSRESLDDDPALRRNGR